MTESYEQNVARFTQKLRVDANFDVLKKVLKIGDGEVTLFYIDGQIGRAHV